MSGHFDLTVNCSSGIEKWHIQRAMQISFPCFTASQTSQQAVFVSLVLSASVTVKCMQGKTSRLSLNDVSKRTVNTFSKYWLEQKFDSCGSPWRAAAAACSDVKKQRSDSALVLCSLVLRSELRGEINGLASNVEGKVSFPCHGSCSLST